MCPNCQNHSTHENTESQICREDVGSLNNRAHGMIQASEANNFGGMYSKRASKDALAVFLKTTVCIILYVWGQRDFCQ